MKRRRISTIGPLAAPSVCQLVPLWQEFRHRVNLPTMVDLEEMGRVPWEAVVGVGTHVMFNQLPKWASDTPLFADFKVRQR